jgi:ubiquinone/menaquinone biosynthesis C-methylase UbiE
MPVVRVNNYLDSYKLRARSEDIHELAARPNKSWQTEFVNRQILNAIQLAPDDVLVDIGCGDASLLRMAKGQVSKCIGIVGSVEEQKRLESAFPGLSFTASHAQSLPLDSACASKIVCNAMLFYLPSEDDIQAALREMARIAGPGAMIWIGEIPEIDEYARYGIYRGTSMLAFLGHLMKHNGLRAVAGMVRRWLKAVAGSEQIVLNSAEMLYMEPEKMLQLAENCGLSLRTYFRHRELDESRGVVDSKFRYDYVFTVIRKGPSLS